MPRALETPRWGAFLGATPYGVLLFFVLHVRIPLFYALHQAAPYGVLLFFVLHGFLWRVKEADSNSPCPAPRNAPVGRFWGAGTPFELPLFTAPSSTLWGAALLFLHGFYGAVKSGFEQPVPRALETPRWGVSRAGHGLFELLFYCTKPTPYGVLLFVLHGFYGAAGPPRSQKRPGGAFLGAELKSSLWVLLHLH